MVTKKVVYAKNQYIVSSAVRRMVSRSKHKLQVSQLYLDMLDQAVERIVDKSIADAVHEKSKRLSMRHLKTLLT